MADPLDWTEQDLHDLIGQSESARLEFKSGRLLDDRTKAIETISAEISAFANSEGGVLVLGIRERREGQQPVAAEIDGVDTSAVAPQWLQQVIESNISPHLAGIRLKRIQLTKSPGRAVIVVVIPKGTTAYQANNRWYYGRSEFEIKPLPDHEVRLRMQRGKVAEVSLLVDEDTIVTSGLLEDDYENPKDAESFPEYLQAQVREIAMTGPSDLQTGEQTFSFRLNVKNTSETTVKGLLLQLTFDHHPDVRIACGDKTIGNQLPERLRLELPAGKRIFPGDEMPFPEEIFTIVAGTAETVRDARCKIVWTAFLDDSPASSGTLDLTEFLRRGPIVRAG